MLLDGLDFLIMVAGVPYIGFASACLSLSRGMHDRCRWEWLGAFGVLLCLYLWMGLMAMVAPGAGHQVIQTVLMGAAFLCLFGFAASCSMSTMVLRTAGAYMVVAGVISALLCAQGTSGREVTAALLGIPATALACWGLHRWAYGQKGYPRAIARLLATALPFIVLSQLLFSDDAPTWASTLVLLLVGTSLALLVAGLNASLLTAHSSEVGRAYVRHTVLLALLLALVLGGAWVVIGRLTALERNELQATADKRDQATATVIREATDRAMQMAVALGNEPSIIGELLSPGTRSAEANSELDRYAMAFNCKAAFVLDASGDAIAASNRGDPDSMLSRNYARRDFFSSALAGEVQAFIGRDAVSWTRGLFAAAPVYGNPRRVIGVTGVTIGLDDMEAGWDPGSNTMLVDFAGKIWMTSEHRLLYQQLWEADSTGTTQPIERVDHRFSGPPGRSLTTGDVIQFDSVPHLVMRTPTGPQGFALLSLTSMRPIQRGRGIALVVTAVMSALVIVVGMSLRMRAESAMARRQEEMLTASISEMERVMSVLSHDLRSPLAASKATVDYLLMAENLDSETRSGLRTIGDEQMRMSDMVTRLLDAIRIRNGGVEWKWEALNAREVIEISFRTIAALPQRRTEVAVDLQIDSLPETMKGDAQAISRLIVNMGANAIRHTYHGSVRVEASYVQDGTGRWLKVQVRDSGEGIGPAVLPLLGKPFVLGGKSSAAGSGLGLAIAIGICAVHGGKLTVKSQLGAGSTFTAWLRTDLDQPVKTRQQAGIEVVDS